jgi:alanine racemase
VKLIVFLEVLSIAKTRYILSSMTSNGYSAWLEIDLDIIRQNVKALMRISQTEVMAVVKANGYGHGAIEIARASVEAGATWCGVARLEEAIALRRAGINCQILVMGYTSPDRVAEAVNNNICLTIYDQQIGEAYSEQAKNLGGGLRLHIKVDTGMGRLGISPETALEFIENLSQQPQLIIDGIFTHFARADEPEVSTTSAQLELFDGLVSRLRKDGVAPKYIHSANSAAIQNFPSAHFDLARPGILLYGFPPSPETPVPDGIQPALTWKTRLTSVRDFPAGHGISYGHIYHTTHTERIGSNAIGYADGYRRVTGNIVLVHGKRVPVVGRVCMDQCMLQLDDVPNAVIGDEVVLLGGQGNEYISAEELAERWGTFNYEVICGLSARLPRIYKNP